MLNNRVLVYKSEIDLSFIQIIPGDWVVIKPNFVTEHKENDSLEWRSVITNPEIIRTTCEYVAEHLCGKGKITICDAPQTDSSFTNIINKLGLYEIASECSKRFSISVDIIDLRNEEWVNEQGIITQRNKRQGDPNGSIVFNLGRDSLFFGFKGEGRYYGADYDSTVVNQHHQGETQEYLLCATPILADVFINLPKMKTHKKSGVTLNLKNVVGINAEKNWLPHHSDGSPSIGGDQFPDYSLKRRFEQQAVKLVRTLSLNVPYIGPKISQELRKAGILAFGDGSKVIRSGNWYGNDTVWRMVLDLNRCLLYGNQDGSLRTSPKRYYCLIDGIIGMEGSGPMQGTPVQSNIIIGGIDPVVTDMVAARVMGFDWRKIPMIREAFNLKKLPLTNVLPSEVMVTSDVPGWNGRFLDIENNTFLNFKPHYGWSGNIEYE